MSDQDFERYLALLSGFLKLSRPQRDAIAEELRDHLEQRLFELRAEGHNEHDAMRIALEEFGDATQLADNFSRIADRSRQQWRKRYAIGAIVTVAACLLGLLSFWPANVVNPPLVAQAAAADPLAIELPPDDTAAAELRKKLTQKVDWEFVESPLSDVRAFIADQLKATCVLNVTSLDAEGINGDTPITANLKGLSAAAALDRMLSELRLEYVIENGILEILSQTDASDKFVTRIYSVTDLIQVKADPAVEGLLEANSQKLMATIVGTTLPDSWEEVGGRGTIRMYRGMMIVSQSERVQGQIENVLARLRTARRHVDQGRLAPSNVELALDKPIAFEFVETPLADMVEFLKESLAIPVLVDRQALSDEGLSLDSTVTYSMTGVPLRIALRKLLAQHQLAYLDEGGYLLITSRQEAEQRCFLQVHSVRDLLAGSSDGRDFDDTATYHEEFQQLRDVLMRTTRSDIWVDFGGPAEIASFRDLIVVTAPQAEQEKLRHLIDRMRIVRQHQGPAAPQTRLASGPFLRTYALSQYGLCTSAARTSEDESVVLDPVIVAANQKAAEAIRSMLVETVEPASWSEAGGPGKIYLLTDPSDGGVRLSIHQSASVHTAVERFLSARQ